MYRYVLAISIGIISIGFLGTTLVQTGQDYNVVFITVEAMNADHVGFHGYDRDTTPNIDSFAEENIAFKNTTTPSASTIYSVPSKFTSLYPRKDNVVAEDHRETDPAWHNELYLVRQFQDEGYYTKAIVGHEYVRSTWGFDRYFDDFDDNFTQGVYNESSIDGPISDFETYDRYWEERDAEETTDLAKDFLDENSGEKFFLWLHYFDPHSPYMPPEKEYLERFRTPYEGENKTEEYYIYGQYANKTSGRIHDLKNRYDGELRYTDTQIGRLLTKVEEEGLKDNTIIVLTSDHGECTGDHNVFDHNKLYRCTLQVPLIFYIPGEDSEVVEKPVSTIDILPTVLDVLGIEYEQFVRGKNILSGEHRDYHYAEAPGSGNILFNYGEDDPIRDLEETSKDISEIEGTREISEERDERLEELGYKE